MTDGEDGGGDADGDAAACEGGDEAAAVVERWIAAAGATLGASAASAAAFCGIALPSYADLAASCPALLRGGEADGGEALSAPVSYTHLTLPTKRIV